MSKVNLAVVRAIIDNDLANLSGDTELVVRFTESVLARDSDTDELREAIRDQWADEGLIAIGYCISSCRVFPALSPENFDGLKRWSGLRPCSPDGLPYLGRVPGHENVIVATGHAMMGLSLGPVTGMLVSDLVMGREPSHSLEQLSPGRFS